MAYNLVRRSTGEVLSREIRSLGAGLVAIQINENEDREIGSYIPDNYDIRDEKGESIL